MIVQWLLYTVLLVFGFVWQGRSLRCSQSLSHTQYRRPGRVLTAATRTLSEQIVNLVMESPLKRPIVGMARNTMAKTAKAAGLEWDVLAEKLVLSMGGREAIEKQAKMIQEEHGDSRVPVYYEKPFHGYDLGNLEVMAAVEQEIAGKAVGARNFPSEGLKGEEVLRNSYSREIESLCGSSIFKACSEGSLIVDGGCGSGTSSRFLSRLFPASRVVGFDLSPFMIAVGRHISSGAVNDFWMERVEKEQQQRVELKFGDIADTKLPTASATIVSLSLVLHELPAEATRQVVREAFRILKPGGVLLIMEMDPQAPGYVKLRNNAALFSILRSTEPWLDEYFTLAPRLPEELQGVGFSSVKLSAATGRHFVIAASKPGVLDVRPSDEDRLKQDMHLNTLKMDVKRG